MREILFRGQTRRYGEKVRVGDGKKLPSQWVYGGIFAGTGDFSVIYGAKTEEFTGAAIEKHTVYSDTVGQYTGLKDKNGKRIFEGDIVQYYERQIGGEDAPIVQPVRFEEGGFCVYRYFLNNWLRDAINGNILLEEIEVIGNIHDNQELLEIK